MGERSMEACLTEQLDQLRDAIRRNGRCGATLQDWYDDGALLGDLVAGCDDDVERHDTIEAWGYLNGVADCLDLTVMEMLDHYGLSFDDAATIRHAWAKPRRKRSKAKARGASKS